MNEQQTIVPSRPQKRTRRVMRRRKARLCGLLSFGFAMLALVGIEQWSGVPVVILSVLSAASAVLAVVLRFTEQPQETLVQETLVDPGPPGVIHARE